MSLCAKEPKLGDRPGTDSHSEPAEETNPEDILILHFRLLNYGTAHFCYLCHRFCAHSLQQRWEMDTASNISNVSSSSLWDFPRVRTLGDGGRQELEAGSGGDRFQYRGDTWELRLLITGWISHSNVIGAGGGESVMGFRGA